MASEEGYNGYPNYETWSVKLWLDNEEWSSEELESFTRHASSVSDLASDLEQRYISEAGLEDGAPSSMFPYQDVINAALHAVRWEFIAQSLWEDYRQNDEHVCDNPMMLFLTGESRSAYRYTDSDGDTVQEVDMRGYLDESSALCECCERPLGSLYYLFASGDSYCADCVEVAE